jgi:hypothetical protein
MFIRFEFGFPCLQEKPKKEKNKHLKEKEKEEEEEKKKGLVSSRPLFPSLYLFSFSAFCFSPPLSPYRFRVVYCFAENRPQFLS